MTKRAKGEFFKRIRTAGEGDGKARLWAQAYVIAAYGGVVEGMWPGTYEFDLRVDRVQFEAMAERGDAR